MRKLIHRWKACGRKRQYQSKSAAKNRLPVGQRVYRCPFCNKWHRATDDHATLSDKRESMARRRTALMDGRQTNGATTEEISANGTGANLEAAH